MLNKIMLIGNVGKEPEMSYTPNGTAVTKFSLAVSRKYGKGDEKKEETTWFNCVAWDKAAETISQHVHKGNKLYVEGRMGSRKYTDKDNIERTAWDVTIEGFEFLTPQASGASSGESARDAEDFPF